MTSPWPAAARNINPAGEQDRQRRQQQYRQQQPPTTPDDDSEYKRIDEYA